MSELIIKTHDFEVAKKGLKEFSEQTATEFKLKKVDSSKAVGEWIGDFLKGGGVGTDHKVTGAELNELTTQLCNHFIDINNMHRKFIREFGQVYLALEALDKDYIQAILISIKATEETSKGVKSAQDRIGCIVEDQKKTIEVLKKFKKKIDSYSHLSDVDKLWEVNEELKGRVEALDISNEELLSKNKDVVNEIEAILSRVEAIKDELIKGNNQLEIQAIEIKKLNQFFEELKSMSHIKEIDVMWDNILGVESSALQINERINAIHESYVQQQVMLDNLLTKVNKLFCLEHLQDVDNMYNEIQRNNAKITELEKQNNELLDLIHNTQNENERKINQLVEENQNVSQSLSQKIKYAYYVAGGAFVMAIIELIIILL